MFQDAKRWLVMAVKEIEQLVLGGSGSQEEGLVGRSLYTARYLTITLAKRVWSESE